MYFSLKSCSHAWPDSFESLPDFHRVSIGVRSCKFSFHNLVDYLTYFIYH